jgi:hypothetical protein
MAAPTSASNENLLLTVPPPVTRFQCPQELRSSE